MNNDPNCQQNITTELVDSLYNLITKEVSFVTENLRDNSKSQNQKIQRHKSKLRNMLRKFAVGNNEASTSGSADIPSSSSFPKRNAGLKFEAATTIFDKAINDFKMPQSISLSSMDPNILLSGTVITYSTANCGTFSFKDSKIVDSKIHWHMVMVSFLHLKFIFGDF